MKCDLDDRIVEILQREGPLELPELERHVLMLGAWWGKSEVWDSLMRLEADNRVVEEEIVVSHDAPPVGMKWRAKL